MAQVKLKKFCEDKGITLTAYSPLGNPASTFNTLTDKDRLLKDVVVTRLAEKYKKSAGQILLKFQVILLRLNLRFNRDFQRQYQTELR